MRRVHHLVGREVDVEGFPVAQCGAAHAAVGNQGLFQALVFPHHVAGCAGQHLFSLGRRVEGGSHAHLQGAAANHAVFKGHVALRLDVVQSAGQVVCGFHGRGEGTLGRFVPCRINAGCFLLGQGQLHHRLGRINDGRVVGLARAIRAVAPLYRVAAEEVANARCPAQVSQVVGGLPVVGQNAGSRGKVLDAVGQGAWLFGSAAQGVDNHLNASFKRLAQRFVFFGCRQVSRSEGGGIVAVELFGRSSHQRWILRRPVTGLLQVPEPGFSDVEAGFALLAASVFDGQPIGARLCGCLQR